MNFFEKQLVLKGKFFVLFTSSITNYTDIAVQLYFNLFHLLECYLPISSKLIMSRMEIELKGLYMYREILQKKMLRSFLIFRNT